MPKLALVVTCSGCPYYQYVTTRKKGFCTNEDSHNDYIKDPLGMPKNCPLPDVPFIDTIMDHELKRR